jgi:hypothetical protein
MLKPLDRPAVYYDLHGLGEMTAAKPASEGRWMWESNVVRGEEFYYVTFFAPSEAHLANLASSASIVGCDGNCPVSGPTWATALAEASDDPSDRSRWRELERALAGTELSDKSARAIRKLAHGE